MTILLSERHAALARIGTSRVTDPATEDKDAKRYWSGTAAQPHEHDGAPPHVLALEELCLEAGARRILEFGCYSGRNLKAIRAAYLAAGEPAPELAGLDINAEAIAAGSGEGLDLRLGDETALRSFAEGEWDVAFTLSVLDHMPDPATALEQLARITRRRLILVEPHPVREGTGRAVRAAGEDARDEPMPFTYLHDYDALLLGLGLVQELDLPMPTHLHRMGPLYRLRVLAPAPVTDLRRLVVQAGAVRLYGLPARTAARFEGAARQDPAPALHIAASTASLETALGAASPADTVIVPRRTAERLPEASPGGRVAKPLDGFLLTLGEGEPSGTGAVRGLERLQDRLLLRILLQNREDAAQMRVLKGRLHRLEESTEREGVVPPPAAGSRYEAAASITHQVIVARRDWMIREIAGLVEEEQKRTIQWQLLLNAKTVAGQVGRTQRETLLTALVGGIRREALRTGDERRLRSSRNVIRQVSAAQHQALIEQVVLLHQLQRGHIRMGLPGWRSLRRSLKRAFKFFWARLPGRVRRRSAVPPGR